MKIPPKLFEEAFASFPPCVDAPASADHATTDANRMYNTSQKVYIIKKSYSFV
jgi:hypothetical protein